MNAPHAAQTEAGPAAQKGAGARPVRAHQAARPREAYGAGTAAYRPGRGDALPRFRQASDGPSRHVDHSWRAAPAVAPARRAAGAGVPSNHLRSEDFGPAQRRAAEPSWLLRKVRDRSLRGGGEAVGGKP